MSPKQPRGAAPFGSESARPMKAWLRSQTFPAVCLRPPRCSASRAWGSAIRALLLVSIKADRLSRLVSVLDTSSAQKRR